MIKQGNFVTDLPKMLPVKFHIAKQFQRRRWKCKSLWMDEDECQVMTNAHMTFCQTLNNINKMLVISLFHIWCIPRLIQLLRPFVQILTCNINSFLLTDSSMPIPQFCCINHKQQFTFDPSLDWLSTRYVFNGITIYTRNLSIACEHLTSFCNF